MFNLVTLSSFTKFMGLKVSVSGMTVSVGGGTINIGGFQGNIEAAEHVVTADTEEPVTVYGYIVQDDAGEGFVFVDESMPSLGEPPYDFAESPYRLIERLFRVNVPAGTTSLEDLTVTVWQVLKEEPEEPKTLEKMKSERSGGKLRGRKYTRRGDPPVSGSV